MIGLTSWKISDIFNNRGESTRDVLQLCSTFSQRSMCPCGPKTFIFFSCSSWPTISSICFSFSFGLFGALQLLKVPRRARKRYTKSYISDNQDQNSFFHRFPWSSSVKMSSDFCKWLAAQRWWQIRHIFPNIPRCSNYGCHCFFHKQHSQIKRGLLPLCTDS